jgi:hypothetical protein
MTMSDVETFTATDFKAHCLEILDRLAQRKLTRALVTKRGKVVAILTPPDTDNAMVADIYGCMKGRVRIPEGFDLTAPVLDEPFLAERGLLFDDN